MVALVFGSGVKERQRKNLERSPGLPVIYTQTADGFKCLAQPECARNQNCMERCGAIEKYAKQKMTGTGGNEKSERRDGASRGREKVEEKSTEFRRLNETSVAQAGSGCLKQNKMNLNGNTLKACLHFITLKL